MPYTYNPFTGKFDYHEDTSTFITGVEDRIGFGTISNNPIATGIKAYRTVPFDCTITGWHVESDGSGNITINVEKDMDVQTDVVGVGTKPSLSAQQVNSGTGADWDVTTLTEGDILVFSVEGTPTVNQVVFSLDVQAGNPSTGITTATGISVDTTNLDNNLVLGGSTVQTLMDEIDDLGFTELAYDPTFIHGSLYWYLDEGVISGNQWVPDAPGDFMYPKTQYMDVDDDATYILTWERTDSNAQTVTPSVAGTTGTAVTGLGFHQQILTGNGASTALPRLTASGTSVRVNSFSIKRVDHSVVDLTAKFPLLAGQNTYTGNNNYFSGKTVHDLILQDVSFKKGSGGSGTFVHDYTTGNTTSIQNLSSAVSINISNTPTNYWFVIVDIFVYVSPATNSITINSRFDWGYEADGITAITAPSYITGKVYRILLEGQAGDTAVDDTVRLIHVRDI